MLNGLQRRLGTACSIKLPLSFDIKRLLHDLEIAEQYEFGVHPLPNHDGTWTAINLIYGGGGNTYTHTGAYGYGDGAPEPTEVLRACSYFQEVIETIPAKVKMARLSALPPGGRILRHRDPIESIDFGLARIHIPIRSDPKLVVFHLGLQRQWWRAGECWYGDFTFPHSVVNKAPYNRVSMIVDVELNDAIRSFFPPSYLGDKAKARRTWLRKEITNLSWHLEKIEARLRIPVPPTQ